MLFPYVSSVPSNETYALGGQGPESQSLEQLLGRDRCSVNIHFNKAIRFFVKHNDYTGFLFSFIFL